jgi:FkbM family methyltransferase
MIKKIITFSRYLRDFIRNRQFRFIITAIKYELTGKTSSGDKLYKSDLGKFYTRKGTLDFQFANWAYEWNVKKFLLQYYKDYDVFIDVGANIGTYSILMAQKGKKVVAFEPVADNFRAFNINLLLNHLQDKVQFFNIGLGRTSQNADFIFDPVNTGASHIIKEKQSETKDGKQISVIIKPFDTLYEKLDIKPDDKVLMKIDTEGMEVEVIEVAKKFLKTQKHILIVLESIHSEEGPIKKALNSIAPFEFSRVDDLNMATKKINGNE